ncbi:UspA domain-containing protein [Halococcus morrhuae DSM 1307]|uniref:UspA domain-containing protein n=1 Tax=Halococcus morrhuae DSM 1307 TaxID=931277 RepID=M0M113_HALMO|nr:universal stress protein [Halococcus morrhuae]EMA39376.1 UspA domain-containing protein [Halococcus morrhuae DSM 1307]
MYTVVVGSGTDHERTLRKARAIVDLPAATDSLAVVLVRAGNDSADPSEITAFFDEHDIDTTVETVSSDPPTALVEVAAEREADLICVGGRTRSPAGKAQLRSGAQSVIVNADRPVLVAGEPDH